MTKEQAIQAVKHGLKVTHKHFSPTNYYSIKHLNLPSGASTEGIISNLFIVHQNNPSFSEGWEIFLTPNDLKAIKVFLEENLNQEIEIDFIKNIRITSSIQRFFYSHLWPYVKPETPYFIRAFIHSLKS